MKVALYVVALVVDVLAILLLMIGLVLLIRQFGYVSRASGVIVASIAILALNAAAIVIAWRSGLAKTDHNATANTFD